MGQFDKFLNLVDKGREGGNSWIPLGLDEMEGRAGLGQSMYFLFGGEPGTGKTAAADQLFVLEPYRWYINNLDTTDKKLRVIYRSMERPTEFKIAKWVSRRLWLDHRILVDVKTILGWDYKKSKIPDEVYAKIVKCREYFERMFETVQITSGTDNPTGIYKQCKRISYSEGVLIKADHKHIKAYYQGHYKGRHLKKISGDNYDISDAGTRRYYEYITLYGEKIKIYAHHKEYYPKNKNIINVIFIDHIGLVTQERGYTEKQTLDKCTEYLKELRDTFGWTPIVISQFNRNIADSTRRSRLEVTPEKQDFKGTGNTYQDADVVMALFNPYENNITNFKGYEVGDFRNTEGYNRFRSLHVLKNSYGIDNYAIATNFIGECGQFYDLPRSGKLTSQQIGWYANPETHPKVKDRIIKLAG